MRRHRSGRLAVPFVLVFLLHALPVAAPVSASSPPTIPLPTSMAAVGDSITQAASTVSLGADAPQNSWSTGTSSSVQSHYLRLQGLNAPINGRNHNLSVSGAKMADLAAQMQNVVAVKPDYLTVLMGGNDLCTNTAGEMTSVPDFTAQFKTAMVTLTTGSPQTRVYVVSIPNVYQLWELYRSSFFARLVWASASICQSLLANPTSTKQADVQRRAQVYQRNVDFNAVLANVCAGYQRCHFDGNAAFNTAYTRSDVAADYFHPSVSGQAKLAAVSWAAGYRFGAPVEPPNQPPVASFEASCNALACSFDAADSRDSDGTITGYAWTFGDGNTATGATPTHTYAAGGAYTVQLTVTDDGGLTGTTSQNVTVTSPSASINLSATGYKVQGAQKADLAWTGTNASQVDVYRNGAKIATISNTGTHTDHINARGGGSYIYKVCEVGSSSCSNDASVGF